MAAGFLRTGPLLAAALGVAGLAVGPAVQSQSSPEPNPEVIISATRESDEAITAKVEHALQEDQYVFSAHMSIVTRNGVVRLQGIAFDQADLTRALMLARQAAGGRRILNEVELVVTEDEHD